MKKLKERLYTVSTLVPRGARVADIGTDHGHLPIYLIQQGFASHCIACDIKEKPLENARANLKKVGLTQIETRLGPGLVPLSPEEIDCICIAGMGGDVIASILKDSPWVENQKYTLILQPMTSADGLRRYLCEKGFFIETERPCQENGKVYTVIKATYRGEPFAPSETFCRAGKITPHTEAGRKYLNKQLKTLKELVADRTAAGLSADGYQEVCTELTKLLSKEE